MINRNTIFSIESCNKFLKYLVAPFVVMLIMLMLFMLKGIYPFGTMNIDYSDMGQAIVPSYYHLYDALHGAKSILFDWYTGSGISMGESISIGSLFSPLNLFFYFIKRQDILYSIPIFTMIKMMAMAASMFIFLNKKFKTSIFWEVLFSVNYAFSGFVLQYYVCSQWLDIAAIFPLVILGLFNLLENNRKSLYILMLAFSLIINFYSSSMILIFLFLVSGLYIMLISSQEQRKQQIWSLGLGTICSIGLSMCIVLPAYYQIGESARFGSRKPSLLEMLNSVEYRNPYKWLMLIGVMLAIVVIVKGITITKNKKVALFVGLSILIVTIPIYFENVNLIWHGGSWVGFPIRFGYIINFVFMTAACYYINKINQNIQLGHNKNKLRLIVEIIFGFSLVIGFISIFEKIHKHIIKEFNYDNRLNLYVILSILLIVIYAFIINKKKHFLQYSFLGALMIVECFFGAYTFIKPINIDSGAEPEHKSDFIRQTENIKNEFKIGESKLDKIKNIGNTLNANYPFIMQRASLSNWTHTASGNLIQNMSDLGYSNDYTRLLDSGGTIFSDALLNIKNTLSTYELGSDLYKLKAQNDQYKLYENKFTLPLGMVTSNLITSLKEKYDNSFDYQNDLFKRLSGQENLIDYSNKFIINKKVINNKEFEYRIQISGNKALYFSSNGAPSVGLSIYVQDKIIPIPSVSQGDNTFFPAKFNNKLICGGAFSNQTINLKVVCQSDFSIDNIKIALLDLDRLKDFTSSYNEYESGANVGDRNLSLKVQGSPEKDVLFLPISYDAGWSCKINGKNAEVIRLANSFIGVKLLNGANNVELNFFPHGMAKGIIISIITIMSMLICVVINKKFKLNIPSLMLQLVEGCFIFVLGVVFTFMYIIPVAYTMFFQLLK